MIGAAPSLYDPRSGSGGLAAEIDRLEAQAGLSWPEEQAVIARALQRPPTRILEVGCAAGAVTERIRDAWPDAAITALEPDGELRAEAERRLDRRGVAFEPGTIGDNRLEDESFDLVLVRYVLQHISDPADAARKLMRTLAAGGTIVVIDVDAELWGVAEPRDEALAALHAAAGRSHSDQGGDRRVGRRLASILTEAGYAGASLTPFCYHSGERGLAAFEAQISPERLLAAVGEGHLAFADYLALVAAHRRFMGDPRAFVLMMGFAASATAPNPLGAE